MDGAQVVIIVIIVLAVFGIIYETGILTSDDNIDASEISYNNTSDNSSDNDSGSNTSSSGSTSSSSASTGSTSYNGYPVLSEVTFYSDGNPNTGETATLYLGEENAGKEVQVATQYYRDGTAFNSKNYVTLKISDDGTVKLTDNTPMSKYPDYCEISVLYNGKECGGAVNIAKHSGTQTVTVSQ